VVPNDNGIFLDLVFTNAPETGPSCHHRLRLKCGFVVANLRLWKVEVSVICTVSHRALLSETNK
jgi:UV DNA damage repair endonuclease